MVKIRLDRRGKKNDPFYRIVAVSSERARGGKALAELGYWHPRENMKKIDKKLMDEWVKKGAQLTPAVSKLL